LIVRFFVVNILWIVFNIPFLFILLNVFLVYQVEGILFFLILLAILTPLLLFPATTAVFASVREWVMKKNEHGGLTKTFWVFYKESYKRSLLAGIIFTVMWIVWAFDVYFFANINTIITIIFLIMGVILFVWTINFFSVTVHYHMKLFETLKNA